MFEVTASCYRSHEMWESSVQFFDLFNHLD